MPDPAGGQNVIVVEMPTRYWDAFACSPANATGARRGVARFASSWLGGSDLWDLELALGEVLSNVVQHGRSPWIAVHCYRQDNGVVTEVSNYGDGFTPPQRFSLPPRGAPRGYGLFLMYTLLDELDFLDGGRRIRLVKKIR